MFFVANIFVCFKRKSTLRKASLLQATYLSQKPFVCLFFVVPQSEPNLNCSLAFSSSRPINLHATNHTKFRLRFNLSFLWNQRCDSRENEIWQNNIWRYIIPQQMMIKSLITGSTESSVWNQRVLHLKPLMRFRWWYQFSPAPSSRSLWFCWCSLEEYWINPKRQDTPNI